MAEDEESGGESSGGSFEDRARAAAPPPKKREKGGGGDDGPDPDAWMVTFSDLLVLLMTFFVLIFASQDPVKAKFFEAFGQSSGVFGLFRTSLLEPVSVATKRDINQDRIQVFLDEIGAVDISVDQDETGLVITLPSHTFFQPRSARLTAKAVERIGQLGAFLKFTTHPIRVIGHADTREARGSGYTGSWSLSVARAHAVLERLLGLEIRPQRLSLVGYGSSRPRFSNVSRLGRERNRRVEIVIFNRGENP